MSKTWKGVKCDTLLIPGKVRMAFHMENNHLKQTKIELIDNLFIKLL